MELESYNIILIADFLPTNDCDMFYSHIMASFNAFFTPYHFQF